MFAGQKSPKENFSDRPLVVKGRVTILKQYSSPEVLASLKSDFLLLSPTC